MEKSSAPLSCGESAKQSDTRPPAITAPCSAMYVEWTTDETQRLDCLLASVTPPDLVK